MVGRAAVLADPAAGHALFDLPIGDLDGHHMVKGHACLGQSLGLANGAGHSVQDEAPGAVRLLQPLGNDADDNGIGDQLARIHIGLGL